jgi:sugar/nucleoside kinase (ribokinase family)
VITTVAGAVALDLLARAAAFERGTSTPASISWRPGGVGYRVFQALEGKKRFLTTVGDDPAGRFLRELLKGGDVEIVSKAATNCAVYVALIEDGELLAAAADMEILREVLTLPLLLERIGVPAAEDRLVLEANLAPDLVAGVCKTLGEKTRVVFEATSRPKAREHRVGLRNLWLFSAGLGEAADVVGTRAEAFAALEEPLRAWCAERNVARALVTDGPRGAWLLDGGATHHRPPRRNLHGRETTGAGDRLLACLLNGLRRGLADAEALEEAVELVEWAIDEATL